MALAPKINFFDGSGSTTNLTISSNLQGFIFTGSVDTNTIDVQIDINGAGFVSDPTLVKITLPNFTVPNPSSYPGGLILDRGKNTIRLRAIDISGSSSPISTITVTVVSESELGVVLQAPTGVQLRRRATSVDLLWADTNTIVATGYNVYASTGQGGTKSGYLKINLDLIPGITPVETNVETFTQDSFSYDFSDPTSLDLEITANTIDPASSEIVSRKSQNFVPLIQAPDYRLDITVSQVIKTPLFLFNHDRNADIGSGILNNDVFSFVDPSDPLFYVVTAVYFNKDTGSLQESRYSLELSGSPLPLDTTIRGIRIRDQSRITNDYITQVQKAQPTLSLIPGSTVREVHIEPFSNEMQKGYFLMDFVHRAKSLAALLSIDDPNLSGTSVLVTNSQYKQNLKTALAIADDTAVQSLIDSSFDALALNFGISRQGRRPAIVDQIFYLTSKPTKDMIISQDSIVSSSTSPNAPRFRTKGQFTIPFADADSFYNPEKRRYEIKAQMVAETPGSAGNVPAGALDTIESGALGFQTVNEEAAQFGLDTESNLSLAENGMRALSSLDSGTGPGYENVSVYSPGVLDVKIVKSGDTFMMRDYDPVRMKHIGGKVDIYIKGVIERTIIETFAFQFSVARNVRFDVIDPINLIFRARDSRLTVDNPIQEMLNNPALGFGLRNHSVFPTASYDLTGVTINDYRTIQLNTSISQPVTLLDDFVEGDYRYRSNNKFTAGVQPIRRIASVSGEVSGALGAAAGFTLFKTQDPLLEGESTIATDYVEINQVDDIPTGASIAVSDEQHVMIGSFEEPLNSVGINTFTLKVFSVDRVIIYNGPGTSNPDYLIVGGTQTKAIRIVRTALSAIASGDTISVDYEHDENFQVTYVVNDVLQQLQTRINLKKHITADAIVKQALENPLTVETTVQLRPNADQSTVDQTVRTNVSILTETKGIGQPIHQSDVAAVIDDTTGVDFIVQPFAKMTLQDGAIRIRDQIPSDYDFLPSLSLFTNAVYILTQPLPFNTVDTGGNSTIHFGVYIDELIMKKASILTNVGVEVGQAYVIGKNGAVISGYSDDATLTPIYITPDAVAAARLDLTANHVVVSLNAGIIPADIPSNHAFSATYIVSGDKGAKDIEVSQIENLSVGDLTITYRSA